MSETTLKGAIAEAAITAAAVELGVVVLRPVVEGRRYDLVFDVDHRLLPRAVQVGSASRRRSSTSTRTCRHTPRGYVYTHLRRRRDRRRRRLLPGAQACYWLPIEMVAGKRSIHLRLEPAANNQRSR